MNDDSHIDDTEPGWCELLTAAYQGDREAFGRFAKIAYPKLVRFLFGKVGDWHAAEDLTQQTFIQMLRTSTFDPSKGADAWVFKIAINCERTRRQRLARRPVEYGSETIDNDTASEGDPGDELEDHEEVEQLLSCLPEEQKEVIVLYDIKGKPLKDIAEESGTPYSTIVSRRDRAIAKLRKSAAADEEAAPAKARGDES